MGMVAGCLGWSSAAMARWSASSVRMSPGLVPGGRVSTMRWAMAIHSSSGPLAAQPYKTGGVPGGGGGLGDGAAGAGDLSGLAQRDGVAGVEGVQVAGDGAASDGVGRAGEVEDVAVGGVQVVDEVAQGGDDAAGF